MSADEHGSVRASGEWFPDFPDSARALSFRRCYRRASTFHGVENLRCDCLRVDLPIEAQAKGSGALGTPLRIPHQCAHQCAGEFCGGAFTCEGCKRLVGWCFGAGDELGAEHCDDCFCDRLAVLEGVKQGRDTRFALGHGAKPNAWRRPPAVVAEGLCSDGFLELKRNGRFALTDRGLAETGRGREVLS